MTPKSTGTPVLEKFIARLKELNKQDALRETLRPLFGGFTLLLFLFCLLLILEKIFYLNTGFKSVYLGISLLVAVALTVTLWRTKATQTFRSFYEEVLQSTGQEKLLNAIDLQLNTSDKNAFTRLAIQKNIAETDVTGAENRIRSYVNERVPSKQFKLSAGLLLAATLLTGSLFALYPADATRAFSFWKEYAQPNPFHFEIIPGDTTAVHGSSIQIEAEFHSFPPPDNVLIHFKTEVENNYRTLNVPKTDQNIFSSRQFELSSNLQYYIEMDGFSSDTFYVNVQQQPGFEQLITTITPPSYTGLAENQVQYPSTELFFYPGSQIKIDATPNKTIESVVAVFSRENNERPLSPSEKHPFLYHLTFSPVQSDTITFAISDSEGLTNQNLYRTTLNRREDAPPVVVITEPTENIQTNEPETVDLIYEVIDDFGITRAELQWELQRAFTENTQSGAVQLDTPRNGTAEQFRWDLHEFDLRPRDILTLRIKAWDNDEISGYKPGESREILIQIPSLAEFFDDIDDQKQQIGDNLDTISQRFEAMEEDYQRFLDRLRQNPEGGFEESQMLDDITEYQQEMEETVQELQEQFRELRSEIENSDQISEETRRSYRELQQLMDELDDPDLRNAMEELRRAMDSLSPDQMEQALQNMSFNEQLYKERIERTIELFRQLQMNSRLENLANRYEEMANRVNPDAPQENNRLMEELDSVSEDLNSAADHLEELDDQPPQRAADQIEQLKEQAEDRLSSIREELQDLQKELQQSPDDADSSSEHQQNLQHMQEQLSEQMMQEADNFRSAIREMGDQQMQVNLLALQRILYTLLELSDQQELLTLNTETTRNQSQGYVELARLQDNISRQFSFASDTLFQISSELPGVPNQINRKKLDIERTLQNAVTQMADRNQRGAVISTRESLGGINDLASMVASLIDQLMDQQNNGGGSGMSMQQMVDQLQNMSGNQQQLNQQLQEMVNDMQGDRLSREQSERLDQMARQQNEIRSQLQELQRDGVLRQGDRTLSELQRMMEDMEESINEMRGGITDPLMVQRQQNILSRMLSAEESLQQRGEQDEREGTPSLDYDRALPPEITLDELEQQIRARMQDPNYSSFSEEYRRIIERYFDELKKRGNNLSPN